MELLVALSIMGIITTLILVVWFGLQDSYSATTQSDHQREAARDAMSRIVRELRDAAPYNPEGSPVSYPAIRYARGDEVRFYTTFNEAGNQDPTMLPTYTRFIVRPGPGVSDGMCLYLEKDAASGGSTGSFTADESRILIRNLANVSGSSDVFVYTSVDSEGDPVSSSAPVTTDDIKTVDITLLVDLNPRHTPQAYRLHATVQPRNLRHT